MSNLKMVADTFRILERAGIRPTYWNVAILYYVANNPGITQTRLSVVMDNPPSNFSPYLTLLVRLGFLAREVDPNDMRFVTYRLTTTGQSLVDAIEQQQD